MALAKATITPESPPSDPIEVLFNPNQYTLTKTLRIGESRVQGLRAPILHYNSGEPQSLAMNLFFDTFETKEDVRLYTSQIYALMDVEAETHVPAIVRFRWGMGAWGEHDGNSFR